MCINLSSSWVFRKVVVTCCGVDSMSVSVSSLSSPLMMERLNENSFIFDARIAMKAFPLPIAAAKGYKSEDLSVDRSSLDSVWGNQLFLSFDKASMEFMVVFGLRIVVVPHASSDRPPINSLVKFSKSP